MNTPSTKYRIFCLNLISFGYAAQRRQARYRRRRIREALTNPQILCQSFAEDHTIQQTTQLERPVGPQIIETTTSLRQAAQRLRRNRALDKKAEDEFQRRSQGQTLRRRRKLQQAYPHRATVKNDQVSSITNLGKVSRKRKGKAIAGHHQQAHNILLKRQQHHSGPILMKIFPLMMKDKIPLCFPSTKTQVPTQINNIPWKLSKSSQTNPLFGSCCLEGKIKVPNLRKPPEELRRLYADRLSGRFRRRIRRYNASNAFTNLGCTLKPRELKEKGPPSFTIHG
ncbi:hypothetical protein MKX01_004773, partial [Papaver californicum]